MEQLGKKHFWIPDTQCKDDIPLDHLSWAGEYILSKRPDVIIHAGDNWDMPSLSSYDKKGSKSFEGRRYKKDVAAGAEGLRLLRKPVDDFNQRARAQKMKQYHPRWVRLTGNHEHRIVRAIEENPSTLEGMISLEDLEKAAPGWEVIPFLQPINIDGILYSHFFVTITPAGSSMGRPITSARALLTKLHSSCIAGHQQGRDIAYGRRGDGSTITALIAGSFYQHDEDFLGIQGNYHWRGIYVLHEVHDGVFDEMPVSLAYLKSRYGK